MTAEAAHPGNRYRLTMWLAHRQPHAMIFAVTANVSSRLVQHWAPGAIVAQAVLSLAALITFIWVFAGILASGKHRNGLCIRCARKTPLDGTAEAQRHDRALRTFHICHGRAMNLIMFGVAVSVIVAALIGADALVRAAIGSVLFIAFAIEAAVGLRHRPLEPWCPYCKRWDDGGDHEVAPTPDPMTSKVS